MPYAISSRDGSAPHVRNLHMDRKNPYLPWLVAGLARPDKSQSGFARHMDYDPSIVNKIVKNKRTLRIDEAFAAADYLGEPAPVILVPIVGRVGADPEGRVAFAEGHETGDFAPIPHGGSERSVGVEVTGHSMRGWIDDGSLIFYEERREPPTDDMLGSLVVVEVDTGEVMVKRLLRGSEPGCYDLESIAAPTRRNARIMWAADITAIIPPKQARRIIRRGGV